MSTDILTPLTLAEIEAGAVPMLYYGIIYDTGFDPAEPWYPCGCPYRLEDSHEGDCWLGWIAYPTWMKEPTGDLVIIRSHTGEIAKIVDARPSELRSDELVRLLVVESTTGIDDGEVRTDAEEEG